MAYKVGDTFIATITAVEDMGMGILYTINNAIQTGTKGIESLEPYLNVAEIENKTVLESKPKEYTLDELQERILVISDLLNQTVIAYREAKNNLKNGIELADAEMERLNG